MKIVHDYVFPAPAGMSLVTRRSVILLRGVPRARGDEPFTHSDVISMEVCSPRPRG